LSYKSYRGGLSAPDDLLNPLGYKFSWLEVLCNLLLGSVTLSRRNNANTVGMKVVPWRFVSPTKCRKPLSMCKGC
jgi:hypothetical protein